MEGGSCTFACLPSLLLASSSTLMLIHSFTNLDSNLSRFQAWAGDQKPSRNPRGLRHQMRTTGNAMGIYWFSLSSVLDYLDRIVQVKPIKSFLIHLHSVGSIPLGTHNTSPFPSLFLFLVHFLLPISQLFYLYIFFKKLFVSSVLFAYICVCATHTCLEHKESRRGCWIPWHWSYKWWWAITWMPVNCPVPSSRMASTLNCWGISLTPFFISF